ncbi:MAG: HDIG domain-containing protein [Verrucomicrobiales bacterium]|nr:HDIG domain-containing protein [Verrucomicrobiales bacterium]
MFHFLSQKRLQSRGFSSGQKRRKPNETAISSMMRSGWQVCGLLFVVFVALVSFWIIFSSSETAIFAGNPLQAVVVVTVITATLVVHWQVSLSQTFHQNSTISLMLSIILIQLLLVKLSEYVATTFAPEGGFRFLVEPYIFAPIAVSLLVGRRHGTFAVVYASLFGGMTVAKDQAFLFIIFSMICGFVAIYLTKGVRKRSRLVMAGAYSGLACVLLAVTLGQIQWPGLGASAVEWEMVGKQALSAILVSTLTAVVVSGLLPLIEATFRITTDVSWMEFADLNHPLLKRMTIEAPGTYHHSLVVATLAETAAEAIGASAIKCRVCSYFHDIGKMKKPAYFVENIGDGMNPHDELTPNMSALIVMAHVKDGVDMALKHKLNTEIVSVIQEHHGTSLIQFFYHRALKLRDEIQQQYEEGNAHEEDIPEVKKESFRYAGPKPTTRESAIISLADSVESASRSLQKPTPKKIDELIDGIFRDRLNDGQLDDAALTLRDLATIKNSFATTLRSMMHTRIEYPKIEEGSENPKPRKKKGKSPTTRIKSEGTEKTTDPVASGGS